jgi:tricorn protease
MKRTLFVVIILASLCLAVQAQANPTLFRQPTVSAAEIVFSYGGDLWTVAKSGGNARRLTTGRGIESNPYFSPDGKWVAFTGQYDGNTDVFLVSAAGGVPKRMTYHPATDAACGWTPDGKRILFSSSRSSSSNFAQLYTMGIDGKGTPDMVPLPMGRRGSMNSTGTHIAYEPLSQWQGDWKYYKGGQQQPIWIADLKDSSIEKLPRNNSNEKHPMWIGDKVYFLSDRDNGIVTLFSFDTNTKKVDKIINNNGLDIKNASSNGNTIVYEQFGSIFLVEAGSKSSNKVNIRVLGDFPGVRPRYVNVGNRISNAAVSPSGKRAVFEARGEIITVPADKGNARNLTNSVNAMERDPSWSPDGKWIAYLSDASGEYELHLRDQTGLGELKKFKLADKPGFFSSLSWSPDSKRIAYNDSHVNLWYIDIGNGKNTKVDTNLFGVLDDVLAPSWSPDSQWIAYAKQLDNRLRAVNVFSVKSGKVSQITDGLGDARHVVFDKSGKYLYFSASTDIGPTISFADLSGIAHQTSRAVYAIVLRNDIPSPLAPESDEETVKPEKKKAAPTPKPSATPAATASPAASPKPAAESKKKPAQKKNEPTRIDLDEIDQRIISLPQIRAGNYSSLSAGKAGILFLTELPSGPPTPPFGFTLHKFDLKTRKFEKVKSGLRSFDLSADGGMMLLRQGPGWSLVSAVRPTPPGKGRVKTNEMQTYVDPRKEWKQMFNEIWRGERDFFYDPGTHGLDIEKAKRTYGPYLNSVVHREDLNYLFREMLNQISVGHMYIGGGEQDRPQRVQGGLLGADYKVENNRYRLAKVYNGENWNPRLRAPLTAPGVRVKAGDYLLSVNGRNITADDNLFSFFESTANKQIVIKIGPNPDGSKSRDVTVVPVSSDRGLRNLAWIENNRRTVNRLSNGKLGYVYIPNTGGSGYTSFNRYFFSQTDKHGAVIDERFNGGGLLADYVVEYLNRAQLGKIAFRDGKDWNVPAGAIYGPKAMLINENAGSGGDAMPWFFKKLNVGALVGKRTWGGLIAAFGLPSLMDGGSIRAPNGAVYGLEGEWEVENFGVAPDIEVENDPAAWRAGRDPQLEKAVEYLLAEIKKNPPKTYKRPAYPNVHKGRPLGKN